MALYAYQGTHPQVDDSAWVAPGASVIGRTAVGAHSSVWFGAVIRADVEPVTIGEYTNIQDNAVIHVTSGGKATVIGNRVTVGHAAVVHACTLEDECLVGMNATVLDGAVVQRGAMVAAGALVSPGKVVESGWLWAGVPARPVRKLSVTECKYLIWSSNHYAALAEHYRA